MEAQCYGASVAVCVSGIDEAWRPIFGVSLNDGGSTVVTMTVVNVPHVVVTGYQDFISDNCEWRRTSLV